MSKSEEKPRADIYARITDRIVAELERGVRPWMQPWRLGSGNGSVTRPLRHNGLPYSLSLIHIYRKVHALLRAEVGWYGEDCGWAIVAITFPDLFARFERRCAGRSVRDSWPDAWETIFGVVLAPGESHEKDRRAFHELHAENWIVVSAIASGQQKGFVECVATPGGRLGEGTEERRFLVPADEYAVGRFGFVINPIRHAVYGGPSSFLGWQGRVS